MTQKLISIAKKVTIVLVITSIIIAGLIYWLFFDISRIPKGDLIDEIKSPSGEYTLRVYLVNGGATTSYAIRGELVYNLRDKKPKNIYWSYKESSAVVEWIDDHTVDINGHILDVRNQVYDWRR